MYNNLTILRIIAVALTLSMLIACKENSAIVWQIGGNQAKSKILVNLEHPKNIKICSDKYKNIGFPVHLNIRYDDATYFGLIEGLCITVHAKKVTAEFASPSSGKTAIGTYEILDS